MLCCRVLNVWDTVLHVCIPRRYRFDEDDDSSEHIEAGRTLLVKEQVQSCGMFIQRMRERCMRMGAS